MVFISVSSRNQPEKHNQQKKYIKRLMKMTQLTPLWDLAQKVEIYRKVCQEGQSGTLGYKIKLLSVGKISSSINSQPCL